MSASPPVPFHGLSCAGERQACTERGRQPLRETRPAASPPFHLHMGSGFVHRQIKCLCKQKICLHNGGCRNSSTAPTLHIAASLLHIAPAFLHRGGAVLHIRESFMCKLGLSLHKRRAVLHMQLLRLHIAIKSLHIRREILHIPMAGSVPP